MKRITMRSAIATAAALLLLLQLFGAADAEADAKASVPTPPAVAAEARKENLDHREKLFLANYATSTELRLSLVTSTVPLSCFSLFSSTQCTGRSARSSKKRFVFTGNDGIIGKEDSAAPRLDGSLKEGKENSEELSSPDVGSKDGRKFFTVWSVAFSTAILTTTFTDSSLTVSLSAMCIPPGGMVPPFCTGR